MRNAKHKTQNAKPCAGAVAEIGAGVAGTVRNHKVTEGAETHRGLLVGRGLVMFVVGLALPLFASCGYTSKPPYNSSVRTVCVPIFVNHTFRREWEFRLTEAIDKNIEYRTPYKIAARKGADTILTGEIVDIQQSTLTNRFGTDLPKESELTVVVNFTWKDLRSGKILVERKAFNRSATDIPQLGERVDDAEQMAIERLATAIVDQMGSDWGTEPKAP